MKPDHAFAGLQNQLHALDRRSLEEANRWKGSKQLLMMTIESFSKQEGRPRATTTTRGGKEPKLSLIPAPRDQPTQRRPLRQFAEDE
jgi:hypothetical protein